MRIPSMLGLMCTVLLLWPASGVRAQFDISPTDSLVAEFAVDSVTRIFQIDFPNTSGDSLGLSWRWISGGWTEGWDVNLCDLGECYTGIPADADMLPMGPEGTGFLKVIVNALELEGSCFLHLWVWPTGNQDALVHVYFDLRNDATITSVGEGTGFRQVSLHPNPAAIGQTLTITGMKSPNPAGTMQRFSPQGALLHCPVHWVDGRAVIETQEWTSGIHFLYPNPHDPPLRVVLH